MKGAIQPNHIAVNKYLFQVIGLPPMTPVKVTGLDEELQAVELPDRTMTSGGNTKATEFTISLPMHHVVEILAMEAWFSSAQDPVLPTYKKLGTLLYMPIGAGLGRSYQLIGLFPKKRTNPELDMKNEGEMAMQEWLMSVDIIKAI